MKTQAFESAEELLTELNPAAEGWQPTPISLGWPKEFSPLSGTGWIFRGQSAAKWQLLPSVFRPDACCFHKDFKLDEATRSGEGDDEGAKVSRHKHVFGHIHAEAKIVWEFTRWADSLPIATPVSDATEEALRAFQEELLDFNKYKDPDSGLPAMPPPGLKRLFALAQHHGIPTRLLDWTRNPYVALFFAVDRASRVDSDEFAVWALNTRLLTPRHSIQVFEGPYGPNEYLKAQGGVFTYDREMNRHFVCKGRWRTLDSNQVTSGLGTSNDRFLIKMVGSASLREEILQKLWRLGISAVNLFPGLDNVKRTMLDFRDLFPEAES